MHQGKVQYFFAGVRNFIFRKANLIRIHLVSQFELACVAVLQRPKLDSSPCFCTTQTCSKVPKRNADGNHCKNTIPTSPRTTAKLRKPPNPNLLQAPPNPHNRPVWRSWMPWSPRSKAAKHFFYIWSKTVAIRFTIPTVFHP